MSHTEHLEGLLCTINDRRGGEWYISSVKDSCYLCPETFVDELGVGAILRLFFILQRERRGDEGIA